MSSFLCEGFLQSWQAGSSLHRGARASHYRGLSRCGTQAPDAQAQQLWLTGPAAPRHVGSSRTRDRTRVPCTCRQTPNHCATREALLILFFLKSILSDINIATPFFVGILLAQYILFHPLIFSLSLSLYLTCVSCE